jgi:hypothetical protein
MDLPWAGEEGVGKVLQAFFAVTEITLVLRGCMNIEHR